MIMIKRVGLDLLRSSWWYVVVVVGGTSAFLIVARAIGYLPYSDRPGPGSYGLFAGATLSEFVRSTGFVLGWALLVTPFCVLAILPTLSAVRIFEWAGFPRLLNVAVGAVVGAVGTLHLVLGMGWYIALDSFTPWLSAFLGAVYGAWLLPRRRADLGAYRPTISKAVVAPAVLGGMIWFMFPTLPSSLLGLRTDSLTIVGLLHRGLGPVPKITIRAFADADSCTGTFVESVTDRVGRFHFYREHLQKDFPENGVCRYDVTVCYADGGEWRRLSSAGTSGPCGRSGRIEFECNLERPDPKCDTKFGW